MTDITQYALTLEAYKSQIKGIYPILGVWNVPLWFDTRYRFELVTLHILTNHNINL